MDNTCKENKNNLMVKYLGFLVHHGVFDEVRVLFLLVGHTHSVIDQRFSVISRELSAQDAYTLDQLVKLVAQLSLGLAAESNRYFVVKQALDWSWLLSDAVGWHMKGFNSTTIDGIKHALHAIRIRKDDSGEVVFEYKEHDRPGPWLGHYDTNEPIPLFKAAPTPPEEARVLPRQRLKKLPMIQEKVKALLKVVASTDLGGEEEEEGDGDEKDYTNFRRLLHHKGKGAKEWWDSLLAEEEEWWRGKPLADEEAPQQPDDSDWDLQSWLPRTPDGHIFKQPAGRRGLRYRAAAAAALAQWDELLPVPAGLELPTDVKWVGRKGVRGDLPAAAGSYNPLTEVQVGDVVMLCVEAAGSSVQRGWELAVVQGLVDARPNGKLFDGVYLRPLIPGRQRTTGVEKEDWPSGWEKRPLVEFTTVSKRNGKTVNNVIWDFKAYDVDIVVWGCTPSGRSNEQGFRLTPTAQAGLLRAIQHLERALAQAGQTGPEAVARQLAEARKAEEAAEEARDKAAEEGIVDEEEPSDDE